MLHVLVLSVLGGYAAVMSDQVNLPATIPLQDYLCNRTLEFNTTVVLDDGEYLISSGPPCDISNKGNIAITGSLMKSAIIRCEGEGRIFRFSSVQRFNMERMTFINCGIHLGSIENTFLTNCTFQSSSMEAQSIYNNANIWITNCAFNDGSRVYIYMYMWYGNCNLSILNCTFQNNCATVEELEGGAVCLIASAINVNITNCTFQNNSANSGGAVKLEGLKGDVSITNCTFQNNSASSGGALHYSFHDKADISLTNCTFQKNSATYGGAVFTESLESKGDTSITNCTFQNNSAASGGAVGLEGLKGDVSITNCTFQNNSASSGGALHYSFDDKADISLTNCTFQKNRATYGGAVYMHSLESKGDTSITNCTFQKNSATYGGAVYMYSLESKGDTSITNCTFQNNTVSFAGGALWMGQSMINATITDCTFWNNNATYGGAIFILPLSAFVYNSTFANNTAVNGAAVHSKKGINSQGEPLGHLLLQDVVFKDNHCSGGGAIYFEGVKVVIFGNTPTGSQFSSNSAQGAIQGQNGLLQLHGNITFTENRGVNGGAISLFKNSPLDFYEGCRVEFYRNVATGSGGAIYNNVEMNQVVTLGVSRCILRFNYNSPVGLPQPTKFSITFTDNHAQQGGHAIYATPIYNCNNNCFAIVPMDLDPIECNSIPNLNSYFTITSLPGDRSDLQVLTIPTDVHLCGCSDPKLCNVTSQYQGKVTTYPGGTVRLNVTSVGDGNNLSPSAVYTQIDTTSQNITLGPWQKAQWIQTVCGMLEYQIYGPEMVSFKLLLYNNADNYNSPAVIEVELLPCEPGFTLMWDSSTRQIKCDCSLFFTSRGVVCDTSDGTVTRNKNNWIGVYNNTLPALASTCPLDYCNSTINKLSLGRPGDLCNGGRTGILCGHCHGNQSVIFGSSKCQVCTDMWLITLVMFAVLGVLLVAALFFLNLTVTQGTHYGLIFYANIIQGNTSIFFSQSILNPMKVIVSFVNLDLGFPLCFYDGMDDADKAGLQFVLPAYLLILTMTVIVFCHYCLQRSPTSSTSSCWYRFPIIIGERAVGVLSTLIYLSYSKLLRTVIDVLTYSTVHLPTGDMYVWFYDGNVEYLHGKHSVLFVVAIVTCTLFLLPYTFALTFIPIIERYSEQNRLFNYLHKKTNQMKPMNDAHYAPYKGEWRWWLGARLWLLVVMYSLNPVFSSDKPSLLLSIQATAVILFTIAQAGIKPFGQSHQKTDRCTRCTIFYNQLYNCLDLFYLLNYIALALSMSYILEQSSDQAQTTVVSVGVLVGLYVVVLMVTVLYHLIVVILKACKMYDRAREKINGLFERKYELMVPMELDDPTTNTVSTTTVTVDYGLREP